MQQSTYYQLSEPEYGENPDIALINGNMDIIDTAMNKARLRDTDLYNENTSYVIGDFCIRNDGLYKCTSPTTGAWDITKWMQTTIAAAFEPKREWELYETYTVDTATAIIQRNLPTGVTGVFIHCTLAAGTANASFGIVVQFANTSNTRRSLSDIENVIQTSTSYIIGEYKRDGSNFWSGYMSDRAAAGTGYMQILERMDNYFLTDATLALVEFRTQTSGQKIPAGSSFKIYIRR